MSRAYDASSDYRNYWSLGSTVEFDAPYGGRLRGEIVRVYFGNPAEMHVDVNGRRYEVNIHNDNATMVWE
jgi:hypothetical protein